MRDAQLCFTGPCKAGYAGEVAVCWQEDQGCGAWKKSKWKRKRK